MKNELSNYMGFDADESENFYFISYNRDDINKVKKITSMLHEKGVPLWYDKGIEYGSGWRSTIGEHIADSESILLFASQKLFEKSDTYVKIEFDIAVKIKKKVNIILLEKIDPQKIPSANLAFFSEVMQLNVINAYSMSADMTVNEILVAIQKNETTVNPPEKDIKPKPQKTGKLIKSSSVLSKAFFIFKKILIASAAIIIFFIAVIVFFSCRDSKADKIFLTLKEMSTKEIAESYHGSDSFYTINIKNCSGSVSDLYQIIENCTSAYSLNISNCSFDDMNDFNSLPALSGLTSIDISGCNLESLNGIEKYPKLKTLTLDDNNITTLSGIEGISGLTRLSIQNNQLTSLDKLENELHLEYLNVSGNNIGTLKPLYSLKELKYLYIDKCNLSELEINSDFYNGLSELSAAGNNSTDIQ